MGQSWTLIWNIFDDNLMWLQRFWKSWFYHFVPLDPPCPTSPDWILFPQNNYCYFFSQGLNQDAGMMSWRNANEYCMQSGGYLVSIHSQEENDFLNTYVSIFQCLLSFTAKGVIRYEATCPRKKFLQILVYKSMGYEVTKNVTEDTFFFFFFCFLAAKEIRTNQIPKKLAQNMMLLVCAHLLFESWRVDAHLLHKWRHNVVPYLNAKNIPVICCRDMSPYIWTPLNFVIASPFIIQ